MEYYNTYTSEYISALNNKSVVYKVKVELLTDQEGVIGEIVRDLDTTQGQLTINYDNIVRRSCSLGLINVNQKYRPDRNFVFWINRKFKLYIGVQIRSNTYWWSQGIFYTTNANMSDYHTVQIDAVDKGGAINGTLKLGMLDYQYQVGNVPVVQFIKDTLALQVGRSDIVTRGKIKMGGDRIIDCAPPVVDLSYRKERVPSSFSVDANSYIGEVIQQVADLFSANAYYDIQGHFRFEPVLDDDDKPVIWDFDSLSTSFEGVNYTMTLDGENTMCVYTNATGINNVSYTAYNTNPNSPINIDTGIRRATSEEIEYLQDVDGVTVTPEQMTHYCRSTANYYLRKNSMLGMQLSFNAPIIPHLDVDKLIQLTDDYMGFTQQKFLIQSITIPFGSQPMNINCTNINWLPKSFEYDGNAQVIPVVNDTTTNTTTTNENNNNENNSQENNNQEGG